VNTDPSRFSLRGLLLRGLRYYWRSNLAVVLGVAVAVAVLVGSLLVGDSVRGSLRDLALERLGRTDYALSTPTFFREALADELQARADDRWPVALAVPAIILEATARDAATGVTVPGVTVLGVSEEFWRLGEGHLPRGLAGRTVAVNQSLAEDLGLGQGDAMLVSIGLRGKAPVHSVFGRRSLQETVRSMRVTVGEVLPGGGLGRFSLRGDDPRPRNVYMSLAWLQRELGREGRANTILVALREGRSVPAPRLKELVPVQLADYGLRLVREEEGKLLSLQGEPLVLPAAAVKAARSAAESAHCESSLTSVYLANELTLLRGGRRGGSIPYSVVVGLDPRARPPLGPLTMVDGSEPPALGTEDILLDAWSAGDLGAHVGDQVVMTYYQAGERGSLGTGSRTLTLRGVVAMRGPAVDPDLVPEFQGITDAGTMADWDPPFPIDLDLLRPQDEAYWEEYRTAPKAFVSLETARSFWLAGAAPPAGIDPLAGWVTSVRVAPPEGPADGAGFQDSLLEELEPTQFGLVFRPVKEEALASAEGSTDFGVLFLSMSMFLVVAAAGLVGLLLRLTVERRAGQYGILLATGFMQGSAARVLLAEGLLLAVVGVLIGAPLGVVYAGLIIEALRTWWQGAVGEFTFVLHVSPLSLVLGSVGGLAVSFVAIWWGSRLLRKARAVMLLAGWQAIAAQPVSGSRRRTLVVGIAAFAMGAVLLISAGVFGVISTTGAFFASGAALLVGSLALAATALRRPERPSSGCRLSLSRLAVRGASRNRLRSLLTMGLLACASFLIVAVAVNRKDLSRLDTSRRDSGAGGFNLLARSALPVYVDLNTSEGREKLGFAPGASAALEGTLIVPFRMTEGDDISCLNVQRPQTARVLGVPEELIQRDGFTTSKVLRLKDGGSETSSFWELLKADLGQPNLVPALADGASAQWILHVGLGQKVTVPAKDGRSIELKLVGMLASSVFASELLVSEENFKKHFGSDTGYRFFLIETPPGKEETVAAALRQTLGELGFDVNRTADVLAEYARVQNTYLATFQTLGGLGLLLGTFGIVTVLLRGVVERRGELAMMLALGFRRSQLVRMILVENGMLLVVGLLVGTVCALVAVAPHLASALADVRWLSLAGLLIACLLVGLVSCAAASTLALRGELLAALRTE